nr:MAG TPA: hypothetical protein [Bacteriophage sp.]
MEFNLAKKEIKFDLRLTWLFFQRIKISIKEYQHMKHKTTCF